MVLFGFLAFFEALFAKFSVFDFVAGTSALFALGSAPGCWALRVGAVGAGDTMSYVAAVASVRNGTGIDALRVATLGVGSVGN